MLFFSNEYSVTLAKGDLKQATKQSQEYEKADVCYDIIQNTNLITMLCP